jgi:hypothetical protein
MNALGKASLKARELLTSAEATNFSVPQRRKRIPRGSVLNRGVVRNGATEPPHGNSLIESYKGRVSGDKNRGT